MVKAQDTKEERILDRVRKLLAVAEHAGTGAEEADTALNMANSLMAKYAIDEALARAEMSEEQRRTPTHINFAFRSSGLHEFSPMLRTIIYAVASANRCKAATFGNGQTEVYGMEEDVRWTEMLYMSIYAQFVNQINPRWDESKGYDENVYNFKVAGYKWLDINELAVLSGHGDTRIPEARYTYRAEPGDIRCDSEGKPDENGVYVQRPSNKMNTKLISAYKRHAKKIGDTNQVKAVSHKAYRRSFSEAFGARLAARLEDMRWANQEEAKKYAGAEVALRDTKEDVNAAFYAAFPTLAPGYSLRQYEQAQAERQAMLDAMTPKQRHDFLEKEAAEDRRRADRDRKAWEKRSNSFDGSAHRRGQAAADTVDLSRKAGFTGAGESRAALG